MSTWRAIAKAETLVGTAKFRKSRKVAAVSILGFVFVWAILIVPQLMKYLLSRFGPTFDTIIAFSLPGLMRSVILIIWIALLIIPLSNALEEIKIGQWEIMLSNNVRTKDILLGTFIAKLPIYGVLVLILAPLIMSPFVIVYEIAIAAQIVIYGLIVALCLSSLWLSNVIATAIQSKLGQSPRGNDIAKALAWVTIPIIALPAMIFMYFMPQFAQIMGMDVFMLLPSTWIADMITWITISFNGVYVPASQILYIGDILWLNPLVELFGICAFMISIIWIGLVAADRYYTIQAGSRTEKVITVGRDNIFLRGLVRVFPGPYGIRVISSMKEFGRKTENISKLAYSIFLTILIPIILTYSEIGELVGDPLFGITMTVLMTGMMMAIFSSMAFGGAGFMDSKDQLWILKSNPGGVRNFIAARLSSFFLMAIPYTLLPSVVISLIMELSILEALLLFFFAFTTVCSAAMVGVGVTATNPSYTDTKSGAFVINTLATIIITMATLMTGLVYGIITIIEQSDLILGLTQASIMLPIIGLFCVTIGAFRLTRSEVA